MIDFFEICFFFFKSLICYDRVSLASVKSIVCETFQWVFFTSELQETSGKPFTKWQAGEVRVRKKSVSLHSCLHQNTKH